MKPKQKKVILTAICCVLLMSVAAFCWNKYASSTHVAFINYQAITLGQISKANTNSHVKISEVPIEKLDKLGGYDMVFLNGMGLRITEEQRQQIVDAATEGVSVLTTGATNPQNHIVSIDSVDVEYLKQYLSGGKANYRNMLNYVRKYIDRKKWFVDAPADPEQSASSLIYYPSEDDNLNFNSVAEYEAYLHREGKWHEGAPAIIVTGAMGVPDSLVSALERTGNNVYPVNVIQAFIARGHADSIAATAMVNMAHGRMGDDVVRYLTDNNVLLFSTVNVNRPYQEWLDDKMGMSGGFLSQSIVTPEIDGAIRPYALFAHYQGDDGLPYVAAIPDRLNEFVATINNYSTLRSKPNKDKRIAIFYFKGPGQNALVASGMEVAPSLFNLLMRLKREGYTVENLPSDAAGLEKMIAERGRVFNSYADGAKADFIRNSSPELIEKSDYDAWCAASLTEGMREDIDALDGAFPGHGLSDEEGRLALARLQFGNVVLIPQTAAGLGDDDFKIVHGTDAAPPHAYVASYMWARHGFGADALIHFGTHGSLEFTPRKQVALSSLDWPDRLVGTVPHFYIYATSNVGEAMTAKRRSYAGLINYLTPPFMPSNVRGIYKNLTDALAEYSKVSGKDEAAPGELDHASLLVKKYAVELGIHRDLRLDSVLSHPYSADEVAKIESFAEELANEKITGANYIMGQAYSPEHIRSTMLAMTVDPIAFSLHKLKAKGKVSDYRDAATSIVTGIIASGGNVDDAMICRVAGISQTELDSARTIQSNIEGSKDMLSRMMVMGSMMPAPQVPSLKIADRPETKPRHGGMIPGMSPEKALAMARMMGADEEAIKKMKAAIERKASAAAGGGAHGMGQGHGQSASQPEISSEQLDFASAVTEIERSLANAAFYLTALQHSPEMELNSIVSALSGGYIAPTSGGDPVTNPNILPTGRNMFAVNAEETPSLIAWEKGKKLAENTIDMYRKAHGDSIPRKVSYTLWSSEFIETEGATIAQVLYMLGVEPIRDPFGRVTDLRLIPSEELGRPRIDVVVQTSGQLRDLAASRLFLISRAVKMASEAEDKAYPNYVNEGVVESERHLVSSGVSPAEARELSTARVFGGINGNYGSGIQGMVEAGDRWEDDSEIAQTYINNMGAVYGSEADWEKMREHAFEAALTRTDVVVQPRQSNTWGALSLDHVYEFMGGMNLAVRNVTGKDPDAYLSDYRNRNNAKMQEVKEAIGVESRTTILNPTYIKEKMKGGAGDASGFADIVRNTYGWNVMKPEAIDDELWDDIYDTYISDKYSLGTKRFFTSANPAALQEISAVMLESARKGLWNASADKIENLAQLHTELIEEYGAACSGFVCDNAKLRDFIASKVSGQTAADYRRSIAQVRAEVIADPDAGTVMKREEMNGADSITTHVNGIIVGAVVIIVLIGALVFVRRRRRKKDNDTWK